MKFLLIFSLQLFYLHLFQQDFKLNGKYRMQYEEKYNSQNCVILFNDTTYIRELPNGKFIKGHILYQKFNVSLKDNETSLQMDFLKREIHKDTIFFGTKDLDDKIKSNGITINVGKLIKIK